MAPNKVVNIKNDIVKYKHDHKTKKAMQYARPFPKYWLFILNLQFFSV